MVKVRHREPAKGADRPGPKWRAGRFVDCSRRRRWHCDPPDYRTQPPHPRLHIGQQGKPHSSRRKAVSRPQGRGTAEGVEESRRKRMLSCNGADRACDSSNTQPERVQTSDGSPRKRSDGAATAVGDVRRCLASNGPTGVTSNGRACRSRSRIFRAAHNAAEA